MQDQISATGLAIEAYKKLKEVDPMNELLKWMESDEITDEDFTNKFWNREDSYRNHAGSMISMIVETNYYLAVRKELNEKFGVKI